MAFLFCVILTFSLPLAISANVRNGQECDNSRGEVWLSGSKVADFAACKQHCEDVAECQSITFYDNAYGDGACSLFSTKCEKTRPVDNAHSELVRELGGLFGVQCDTSQGEVWLSGIENADFASCMQKCEDDAGCQSITFYHNGDCSLFATKCEKTVDAPGAQSKVVKELEGKFGQQCDHSQGEIWLSESKVADFVNCKRSCEDDPACQSVTFYSQSGVCSHFATMCDKTVPSNGAISAFVKENEGPAPEQCEIDGTCTIARGQECDRNQGEFYMNDGSADLSYEECKQACLDRLQCQSITYFSHGWCSLFKTQCQKRKHFKDAISVTLKADFFNGQECDTSKGEVLLSGSSGNQATLAACRQSCEDDAQCKSTTYFKSGWCKHFSTCCNERRASGTATSDAVKTAKCVDACAIENGECDTRRANR